MSKVVKAKSVIWMINQSLPPRKKQGNRRYARKIETQTITSNIHQTKVLQGKKIEKGGKNQTIREKPPKLKHEINDF